MAKIDTRSLRLVILGGIWDLPTISPFGLKLATWLRMAGIEHETRIEDNPTKGPKKASPWIERVGADGAIERIGDTELIIERLVRERGVDPDAHLSAAQRATGLAIRRMFETHFSFTLHQHLFVADEGWAHSRRHFDFLPGPIRGLVTRMIRKDFKKALYYQGLGRHTPAEIDRMACDDLDAAASFLGDAPYFLGGDPTQTDCSAYGFLAITLWSPVESAAQRRLRELPTLVAFCERMRARFWRDAPATEAAGDDAALPPSPTIPRTGARAAGDQPRA